MEHVRQFLPLDALLETYVHCVVCQVQVTVHVWTASCTASGLVKVLHCIHTVCTDVAHQNDSTDCA